MPPNNQFTDPASANLFNSGPITPAPEPSPNQALAPGQPAAAPKTKLTNPNSTQNTLMLSEIRDNMVIMSDGSFRAVVACKSINFDLMSNNEREGVEYAYQNFLNSLAHPIQILIRSQRIDIAPYIDKLVHIRRGQDNMLLNVLMDDYINFIDILSQEANIMDKSFFITVPYYPENSAVDLVGQSKGFFSKIFSKANNNITKIDNETYEKAKVEVKNRVDGVMAGLFQMGVQSAQLSTKELGELYYNFYNPDTAVREPLGNFEEATALYVKKAPTSVPPQTEEVI